MESCGTYFFYYCTLSSGVHVQILQDCSIGTHMPWWFAASITLVAYIRHLFLPILSLPNLPTCHCPSPSLPPATDPSVWCSSPCAHVFSLFNTCLWVRTCGVWFCGLLSVCWECWFPDSSMSLQRTWTHHFLWLHSIPWCIYATFSLSSLSLMGIWVASRSLLL